MRLKSYSVSIKSLLILFSLTLGGLQVKASTHELEYPRVASISHPTTISNLKHIVKEWGREASEGKGFRWVELYHGTRSHPNAKLSIVYLDTVCNYDAQQHKRITKYDLYREFCDNRRSDKESPTVVTHSQGLESFYRYAITRGINVDLAISADISSLPIGASFTPKLLVNSTKEKFHKVTDGLTVTKTISVPAHTAARIGLTISREEFEFPFTSGLLLMGDVVLCTRKPLQITNRQGGQQLQRRSTQESGHFVDQEDITLSQEEDKILTEIEQKYSHFPNIRDDEEYKRIEEEIKEKYLNKFPAAQESLAFKGTESGDIEGTKPRSVNWLKRLLGSYKEETFPISTVLQKYFANHPEHPDVQYYTINDDEVIFKAQGIIKGAREVSISVDLLATYHKDQWPTEVYSKEDLEARDL